MRPTRPINTNLYLSRGSSRILSDIGKYTPPYREIILSIFLLLFFLNKTIQLDDTTDQRACCIYVGWWTCIALFHTWSSREIIAHGPKRVKYESCCTVASWCMRGCTDGYPCKTSTTRIRQETAVAALERRVATSWIPHIHVHTGTEWLRDSHGPKTESERLVNADESNGSMHMSRCTLKYTQYIHNRTMITIYLYWRIDTHRESRTSKVHEVRI